MRGALGSCALVAMCALVVAAPAAADTLPGRDTPFRAAQAPADQYTTPTPVAPLETSPTTQPSDRSERGGSGENPSGGTEPLTESPGVAGVDRATSSPRDARGTLPFTGADLLALVWIALALIVAGTAVEIARRRFEARRV